MPTDMPQQGVPIVIKPGSKKLSTPIQIVAYSDFNITQPISPGSNNWTSSKSDDEISYIESVVLGQNEQFCQTSTMKHPITLTFKDSGNNNIFKVAEVEIPGSSNFTLSISVEYLSGYFQSSSSDWSESKFDPSDIEIYLVEVTDINNVPTCQLVREKEGMDFILNLEAPV